MEIIRMVKQEDFRLIIMYYVIGGGFINRLSFDEKFNAFMSCDESYNHKFYTAVKTTGIFCLPSCKCKKPKKKNIKFYDSFEKALEDGYRPCKICKPLESNKLALKTTIKDIKKYIDENYSSTLDLKNLSSLFEISEKKILRYFKLTYDTSPKDYINDKRIQRAEFLLKNSKKSILEVSLEVGFNSLSSFYSNFKKRKHTTPSNYRIME